MSTMALDAVNRIEHALLKVTTDGATFKEIQMALNEIRYFLPKPKDRVIEAALDTLYPRDEVKTGE